MLLLLAEALHCTALAYGVPFAPSDHRQEVARDAVLRGLLWVLILPTFEAVAPGCHAGQVQAVGVLTGAR